MSPLSNQLQEGSLQVLKDLLRRPDHRLAEKDVHQLGLDVEILAAMYEANVKPYLDFIMGYEDLSALDPQDGRNRWAGNESWEEVLGRHDSRLQYSKVAKVLQARLWTGTQVTDRHLAVFLSRRGQWIVWHKRSSAQCDDTRGRESVAVFATIEKMCLFLNELVTDDYTFTYQFGQRLPRYAPLRVAYGLLALITATIEKRQTYLASFQSAHDEGSQRLSLIEFKG